MGAFVNATRERLLLASFCPPVAPGYSLSSSFLFALTRTPLTCTWGGNSGEPHHTRMRRYRVTSAFHRVMDDPRLSFFFHSLRRFLYFPLARWVGGLNITCRHIPGWSWARTCPYIWQIILVSRLTLAFSPLTWRSSRYVMIGGVLINMGVKSEQIKEESRPFFTHHHVISPNRAERSSHSS